MFFARRVIIYLIGMRIAVNLDHEPGRMTIEVSDEPLIYVLSSKSQAKYLTATTPTP